MLYGCVRNLCIYLFLIYTHTHTHTPACNCLQTRTIGMDPPTEDTQFLTHHYSTMDIMWLFTTQPRTSPYTPNRGHGLNSIFKSFPSSCSPREPRTVNGVKCVLGLLWNFMCVSLCGGVYIPTHPGSHTHLNSMHSMIMISIKKNKQTNKQTSCTC